MATYHLHILLIILGFFSCMSPLSDLQDSRPVIYLIGDSTMADKEGEADYNPERGWGQLLPEYFDNNIRIENHAVNGRSSKSFIAEGRWEAIMDKLGKGDYVLIQFGHNDQKYKDPSRYTNPTGAYYQNLATYVKDTRSKGATPILLTSIVRRNYNEYSTLEDTHGIYPLIVRQVATDLNVLFIDHLGMTEKAVIELGKDKSKELYLWLKPGKYGKFPEGKVDNTHLSPKGAKLFAGMVAQAMSEMPINIVDNIVINK